MAALTRHLGQNWGWYLFGGTVGTAAGYIGQSYVSANRRDALRSAIEKRMPVNSEEMLEVRSSNEITVKHAVNVLDGWPATSAPNRRGQDRNADPIQRLLLAMKGASGQSLTFDYVLERMLRSIGGVDDGNSSLAVATIMFSCVDSVNERLEGMFRACASGGELMDTAAMRRLLEAMLASGQVPVEKRLVEVKMPFYASNDWREVTIDDLFGQDEQPLDVARFKSLLCSDNVCIWGECYRLAEEAARKKAEALTAERERNPPWWAFWRQRPPPASTAPSESQ